MKRKLLIALSLLLTVSMLVISASLVSGAFDLGETAVNDASVAADSGETGASGAAGVTDTGASGASGASVASYASSLKASDGSVELDGTNPGTVTVSIACNEALTCYDIEGVWDVADASGKITLTDLSSDVLTFDGYNYVDVPTGKVMWVDELFAAEPTTEGEKLLTATYTVAADTPEGEYTVRFLSEAFTGEDGVPDETATYFTATITVTHKPTGLKGDVDLDGDVDSDDLTLLARHVGGIELIENATSLLNADVDESGEINSDDLTKHARYVGGIITDWSQE